MESLWMDLGSILGSSMGTEDDDNDVVHEVRTLHWLGVMEDDTNAVAL